MLIKVQQSLVTMKVMIMVHRPHCTRTAFSLTLLPAACYQRAADSSENVSESWQLTGSSGRSEACHRLHNMN